MESYFIVCFDFYKCRAGYSDKNAYRSEVAEEYMDICDSISEKIITRFANKCISLSNNTFLIQSTLKEEELLQLLVAEFTQKGLKVYENNSVNEQIYLSRIERISSFTFKEKKYEIEYLFSDNK